jgi:hypothetical protein
MMLKVMPYEKPGFVDTSGSSTFQSAQMAISTICAFISMFDADSLPSHVEPVAFM